MLLRQRAKIIDSKHFKRTINCAKKAFHSLRLSKDVDHSFGAIFRTLRILSSHNIAVNTYMAIPSVGFFIFTSQLFQFIFQRKRDNIHQLYHVLLSVAEAGHFQPANKWGTILFDAIYKTQRSMAYRCNDLLFVEDCLN